MANISTGRVQDWINAVINPVLLRLRQTAPFLPQGPWELHANTLRLENICKIEDAIFIDYRDYLDDFVDHQKKFAKLFKSYDEAVDELELAVKKTFKTLVNSKPKFPSTIDELDQKYLLSYAAGNFTEVPGSWSNSKLYNQSLGASLRKNVARDIQMAVDAAQNVNKQRQAVIKSLIETRTTLVNKFGARLIQVTEFTLG